MTKAVSFWQSFATGLQTAGLLLGSLAILGGLGYVVDRTWTQLNPFGLLTGLVLGLGFGSWQVLKNLPKNTNGDKDA